MLENAACPFKMYGHNASQVSTKKRDLVISAKSWMVGRYVFEEWKVFGTADQG